MPPDNHPFVGDQISSQNGAWTFDNSQVAENFEQHAKRSIPLYSEGHQLVCDISDFFLPTSGRCYELGCSRGDLLKKLTMRHLHKNIEWFGIDNSESMIAEAKKQQLAPVAINWLCEDISTTKIESADFIVAYYTVQFVPPRLRQALINKLYEGLNWGGALLLFEKVRGPDARFQDMLTSLYTEFKLNNGYQAEEIVNKSRSLKGILEPFSTQGNLDMLHRAGFKDITTVMKYLCFEGFLAIK
jgi:tRNA (cmo5U34)-methyltransferase